MIDFEYQIIRAKRKSYEFAIYPNGAVVVRCPKEATDEDIKSAVEQQSESISRSLTRLPKIPAQTKGILIDGDVTRLKQEAQNYIPERVAYFSSIMGVTPDKIQITTAHKKWASCVLKRTIQDKKIVFSKICFSYRVMLLPEELRDFVIKHELAHMFEIKHTPEFFAILAKYEPNHLYLGELVRRSEMALPSYTKKK